MTNAEKISNFDALLANYDTTTLAILVTAIIGIITSM